MNAPLMRPGGQTTLDVSSPSTVSKADNTMGNAPCGCHVVSRKMIGTRLYMDVIGGFGDVENTA
jgi:hypothetical protein